MKRFFSIATLMVMALLMFVSCSNNDEPKIEDMIVGTWEAKFDNGEVITVRLYNEYGDFSSYIDGYQANAIQLNRTTDYGWGTKYVGRWYYSAEHQVVVIDYIIKTEGELGGLIEEEWMRKFNYGRGYFIDGDYTKMYYIPSNVINEPILSNNGYWLYKQE